MTVFLYKDKQFTADQKTLIENPLGVKIGFQDKIFITHDNSCAYFISGTVHEVNEEQRKHLDDEFIFFAKMVESLMWHHRKEGFSNVSEDHYRESVIKQMEKLIQSAVSKNYSIDGMPLSQNIIIITKRYVINIGLNQESQHCIYTKKDNEKFLMNTLYEQYPNGNDMFENISTALFNVVEGFKHEDIVAIGVGSANTTANTAMLWFGFDVKKSLELICQIEPTCGMINSESIRVFKSDDLTLIKPYTKKQMNQLFRKELS